MELSSFSYQKFINFAVEETQRRTTLTSLPSQEKFKDLKTQDGRTQIHALSFKSPRIRLLRGLNIEGSPSMQVLDFAVFPEPCFDLPIFCANFFTTANLNIVVLDLNPLYDVTIRMDYREKYYKKLIPLGQKYAEVLPWGDKLTSESITFFSPVVLWSKFSSSKHMFQILYSAFKDYFLAWLELMELATEEENPSIILQNREAQHRYLSWRAEKDPGHPLMKRLIGESLAKDMVRQFLFEGVDTLGNKSFLDYFPEYTCEDGSVNRKRSMIGKSYKLRPWDANGDFIDSVPA